MKHNKKTYSGFTLIELMISLAIVSILMATALPSYVEYISRAQVTEGFILSSPAKMSIVEHFALNGTLPSTNEAAGFRGAVGKYVSSINIGQTGPGIISINFGNEARSELKTPGHNTIFLTPHVSAYNTIQWSCSTNFTDINNAPHICRN